MTKDFDTIQMETRGGTAIAVMNNPPVNQLSRLLFDELMEILRITFESSEINALVLTGAGKNFIAGADISHLEKYKSRQEMLTGTQAVADLITSIESSAKPVIAAINGNAFGGGLELAMACHYRVAVNGVYLGLPEVTIGLIPGAGGNQRLPRLIGLNSAIEMITSGNPIKSEAGHTKGLIDMLAEPDKLVDKAVEIAKRFVNGELDLKSCMTRNIHTRLPSAAEKKEGCNATRMMLTRKAKGFIAPFKAVEAIEKGLSFNIEKDIEQDGDIFCECAESDVAKNLINIFFTTRSAGRLPQIKDLVPAKIKKVAVLGGGVMGAGIVNLLLRNGYQTTIWEMNDQAIEMAMVNIRKTFAYPIKKGKMTPGDLNKTVESLLRTTTSLAALENVDLAIEAVQEDMKIKQDIFKKLEDICPSHTLFATNTSALPIGEMASILDDPGRMIGLHFFNPAEQMQLLEVICTKKTSEQTLASSVAFVRAIKKVPIVVNDGPGFYVTRQLTGLMAGGVYLMADGVDCEAIEIAMTDFGIPMGPAMLSDLTGIDISFQVCNTFECKLGDRYKIHPLIEQIYQTGCYGRKTGAGYYDYTGSKPVFNPIVMREIQNYQETHNVSPKEMSKQDIQEVMLALAINEAVLMMEEGICDRPRDMDLAMIYGTGFPTYRGGLLRYADKWGIKNIYAKLLELEKQYGQRFAPAKLLMEMVQTDKTFYQK